MNNVSFLYFKKVLNKLGDLQGGTERSEYIDRNK